MENTDLVKRIKDIAGGACDSTQEQLNELTAKLEPKPKWKPEPGTIAWVGDEPSRYTEPVVFSEGHWFWLGGDGPILQGYEDERSPSRPATRHELDEYCCLHGGSWARGLMRSFAKLAYTKPDHEELLRECLTVLKNLPSTYHTVLWRSTIDKLRAALGEKP